MAKSKSFVAFVGILAMFLQLFVGDFVFLDLFSLPDRKSVV